MKRQWTETNAITYTTKTAVIVTVKAGTSEGDAKAVEAPGDETYWDNTYGDEYDADCNICGAKRNAASRPSYAIIEGANSKWILNEDGSLSIKGNGDFDKVEGVKVDDKLIGRENYNVRPGSTVVELKPDYLNTLAAVTAMKTKEAFR